VGYRGSCVSSHFNNRPSDLVRKSDEETVAALVAMLSGMGIDRVRIDAMINKTARPDKAARSLPKAGNLNERTGPETSRRAG
jgi:hypothetical protein